MKSIWNTFSMAQLLLWGIIGANMFKDLFAGIRDIVGGRAGAYEKVLAEAKDTSIQEMIQRAQAMGATSGTAVVI